MKYEVYLPGESKPQIWDTNDGPFPSKGAKYGFPPRKGVFVVSYIVNDPTEREDLPNQDSTPQVHFRRPWTRESSINL